MGSSGVIIPEPLTPALSPPPGTSPCFTDPYTLKPYQDLEIAACVGITTVMLAARIYTKLALIKHFTWEDGEQVSSYIAVVMIES